MFSIQPAPAPASAPLLLPSQSRISNVLSTVAQTRSEEHTSELQSLMRSSYAVFGLKNKRVDIAGYKNNMIGNSSAPPPMLPYMMPAAQPHQAQDVTA